MRSYTNEKFKNLTWKIHSAIDVWLFFYWLHCINYFLDLWASAENQYIYITFARKTESDASAPHVLFPKNRYASGKNLRNGMRRGCFLMRWDGCVCARVVLKGFQCFYFEFYVSPVFYTIVASPSSSVGSASGSGVFFVGDLWELILFSAQINLEFWIFIEWHRAGTANRIFIIDFFFASANDKFKGLDKNDGFSSFFAFAIAYKAIYI